MKYFLGIDNGGTLIKACVFDEQGNLKGKGKSNVNLITPFPKAAERNPDEIFNANIDAINNAIKNASIKGEDITAIGLSGHGKGLYMLDKNGKSFTNSLLSSDARATQITQSWKADGTEDKIFDISLNRIVAGQPLPLLKWFKTNDRQTYDKTAYVLSVNDYIRYRLTGVISCNLNDLSGSALINLKTGKLDEKILKLAGIKEVYEKIAPIISSFDIGGKTSKEIQSLTGIKAGTPVTGGLFDINACALSLGMTDENILTIIAGTWSINETLSKTPATNSPTTLNSIYCIKDYFLIEESSPTSSGNLEWVRNNLFNLTYEEINNEVANTKTDLIFLPFIMGTNLSPYARSAFLGMTSYHNRAHMLRAVYEGVAFSHRTHIERLKKNIKGNPVYRMAGGAVNSAIWMQIFSDVLNTPIETTKCEETGCFGAAVCAMIAEGSLKKTNEINKLIKLSETYYPNKKSTEELEESYQRYIKLNTELANFWEEYK